MTYSTLMVYLDIYQQNDAVLQVAGALAQRFSARVVGVAAWRPLQVTYADGYVDGEIFEQDRTYAEQRMKETEDRFRASLQKQPHGLEWRSASPIFPSEYVAHQARSADLIIVGAVSKEPSEDSSRRLDTGEFVMQVGRPVLIVPSDAATLTAESILVAWKDSREARRAILDALPLLKTAQRVIIAEISREEDLPEADKHVKDVANWLHFHDVAAECVVTRSDGDDSGQLTAIAQQHGADLIVAGAYGHSRLREWAFGGVTRDLIRRAERCALISH